MSIDILARARPGCPDAPIGRYELLPQFCLVGKAEPQAYIETDPSLNSVLSSQTLIRTGLTAGANAERTEHARIEPRKWRGRASVKPSPLALELQHLPTNIVAIPPVLRIPKETFNSLAPHESEKVLAARARLGARCIGLELF